jgi:hypothetical protein
LPGDPSGGPAAPGRALVHRAGRSPSRSRSRLRHRDVQRRSSHSNSPHRAGAGVGRRPVPAGSIEGRPVPGDLTPRLPRLEGCCHVVRRTRGLRRGVRKVLLVLDDGRFLDFRGVTVTPTFFDTVGRTPFLGRAFETDDEKPQAEGAIVISYPLWRKARGSDSSPSRESTLGRAGPPLITRRRPDGSTRTRPSTGRRCRETTSPPWAFRS